jgi:hypothetical protein
MPWPTFHLTISGTVVALYAAVVSTLTGVVQISNYFRDRANIRVTVQHRMEIYGDPRYKDKTLTVVSVINAGRRPVTITAVGAYRVHPHNHFVLTDCSPALPHELTEGKRLSAILPSADMDFSTIDYWDASDAVGNSYKCRVASRYAHYLSVRKWRREWRRNRKTKAKTIKGGKAT